jgi:hypothetical protein
MKRLMLLVVLAVILMSHSTICSALEERDKIEETLRFDRSSDERRVIVDNVFGSIKVTGYSGDEVRMVAQKTIVAKSDKKLARAKEEVRLEISEDDGVIEFYVDGPFRDKRHDSCIRWRGFKREGYKVVFDFELQVPEDCDVEIKTVNEGDIFIESISGDFEVNNVNGDIEMERIDGSGEACTVNGDISLDFARNPQKNCSFKTINGEVRLHFLPRLSADFYLKTFNGEIFTDFEVESLPSKAFTASNKNGKRVYKAGHICGVRAGQGGPEIAMDGFNGDMFILKK